ncbi:DUF423 domain-containing protein [Phenylobacterium sp.]|jgi:uncharacterized membrane protein YgdD (TMEM256/DUF423 family)|uniref:DUF423 domain-containing protein n=1 Tax=Phenylobacterium sp. TaxID=1871053 RepID=UPI0035B10E11
MSKLRPWMFAAAVGGFLAVGFGAFAAHGLGDPKAKEWMHTGATYAFMHVMAVFAAAFLASRGSRRARIAPPLFLAGVVLFSGSLFAMALGAPRWFGAITPIGGLLFLVGWAVLAWASLEPGQD